MMPVSSVRAVSTADVRLTTLSRSMRGIIHSMISVDINHPQAMILVRRLARCCWPLQFFSYPGLKSKSSITLTAPPSKVARSNSTQGLAFVEWHVREGISYKAFTTCLNAAQSEKPVYCPQRSIQMYLLIGCQSCTQITTR